MMAISFVALFALPALLALPFYAAPLLPMTFVMVT
jgi:hypothetical protein